MVHNLIIEDIIDHYKFGNALMCTLKSNYIYLWIFLIVRIHYRILNIICYLPQFLQLQVEAAVCGQPKRGRWNDISDNCCERPSGELLRDTEKNKKHILNGLV